MHLATPAGLLARGTCKQASGPRAHLLPHVARCLQGLDTNAQPIKQRVAVQDPTELGPLVRPGVDDG